MKRITVLLVDDHAIFREGLRVLLEAENDIEVVGDGGTGREALDLVMKLRPSVVVMDISMPQLNGMEATRQILQAVPTTKVLILSAHRVDVHIEQVMAAGASGYVVKQVSSQILAKAIREIHKGNTFFRPSIAKRAQDKGQKPSGQGGLPRKQSTHLTSREMEVLQLVAEGLANKQVADELAISIKTVEKHRQSLMEKLNIHDTAGLTRYAIAAGIIESGGQP